ncbi:MAG: Hsp70 family protein [Rudaea sp.]|uniref:Hsp70 family protein n=1 Tax=unclassified Rudaea TaxID=2627037 RepID=UPI0010F63CB5|nr:MULTISPECIES: Hsp70 family protein [unclassified Rudaea]MBN8884478.1 Hsp70 family protein [Rudaea sp.]
MRIGIDFGTSYSAAAVFRNDRVEKIRFAAGDQFRTAVYFPEAVPNMDEFQMTPEIERDFERILRQDRRQATKAFVTATARWQEAMKLRDENARNRALALLTEPKAPDDNDLRKMALRVARQHWREEQVRTASVAEVDTSRAVFGDDAIDDYLDAGTGILIQSPKSMLGFDLNATGRARILNVVGHILEHIRLTATKQLGSAVHKAVIGRPVEFRSSLGPAGTEQARALMTEAAIKAGYDDDIEFLEEPVAASHDFHRKCEERTKTLVVDVGGGTTDFAFVELGGSRKPNVIKARGFPMGGTDVDLDLGQQVMPLFGRDLDGGAPAHHYVDALSIHNPERQRQFAKRDYKQEEEPFLSRLRALQRTGNTQKTARLIEQAKVELSTEDRRRIALGFIEKRLAATVDQASLLDASDRLRFNLEKELDKLLAEIGCSPDAVFVTGGMSRSPYLIEILKRKFPNARRVRGNASFAVVNGLALYAAG